MIGSVSRGVHHPEEEVMMNPRKRLRLISLAGAIAALLVAGSVSAASPWTPLGADSFQLAAGTRCPFTLRSDVTANAERIRTLETYPDATPRLQEVVGLLLVRYTNVESGESVERNLTGTALVEYPEDGGFILTLVGGHMAIGLPPTVPGGPAYLVFTGTGFSLDLNADGSRTITYGNGQIENICDTLG
jgi:hypothetical protein